jgi:hypothetical protein
MNSIYLRNEHLLLRHSVKRRNKINLILDLVWVLGLLSAIVFHGSPKLFRVILMSASSSAMVTSIVRNRKDERREDVLLENVERLQDEELKQRMGITFDRQMVNIDADRKMAMLQQILRRPKELQYQLLVDNDLLEFAQGLLQQGATVQPLVEAAKGDEGDRRASIAVPSQAVAVNMAWDSSLINFPVEDIAEEYVRMSADPDSATGLIIIAPSRTGKTSLMQAMVKNAAESTNYQAKFVISDGKGTGKYCGLERSDEYCLYASQENVSTIRHRLSHRRKEMIKGEKVFIITDEFNNILITAESADSEQKPNSDHKKTLMNVNKQMITQGGGLGTILILSVHNSRVESIGFNTGDLQNLKICALGRNLGSTPQYTAIPDMLNNDKVIASKELRDRLKDQYTEYMTTVHSLDDKRVLCLQNITGDYHFCFLPDYSAVTMPNLLDRIEYGGSSSVDTAEQSSSPQIDREQLKNGLEMFIQWAKQQTQMVTDEAIAAKMKELMNIIATAGTIKMMRDQYIGGIK